MARWRLLAGALVSAILVVVLVRWLGPASSSGFATPQECVEAYREACLSGDVAEYRRCLTAARRAESERRPPDKLADELRSSMAGVKSWVQNGEAEEEAGALVEVDVVRPEGTQRIGFHLQRGPGGWLIDRVDAPRDVTTPVRHGTHVSEVPE